MNKYQEAISITEHYRETKSRFTWIGEIEDERLLSALENLSDADLNLVTMYAYEGYTVTEISKVLGVAQPTISIKIKRITKFFEKLQFQCYGLTLLDAYQVRGQFTRRHKPQSETSEQPFLEN